MLKEGNFKMSSVLNMEDSHHIRIALIVDKYTSILIALEKQAMHFFWNPHATNIILPVEILRKHVETMQTNNKHD